MRHLKVKDFSCIKSAALDFAKLTIIIGPQASGKSVLCKLSYFFIEILNDQSSLLENQRNLDAYKDFVKAKFFEWFPEGAWGAGKFLIEFKAGDYSIALSRKIYKGVIRDDFSIRFSQGFEAQYEQTRQQVGKFLAKSKNSAPDFFFERDWEILDITRKSNEKLLGKDYVASQCFIPAGRSFFTSIGKAVAAFEQGRILDPLIVRFGRLFTSYKETRRYFMSTESRALMDEVSNSLSEILGGKLITTSDQEYVQCADGRKIPLSALSSGQQELLPLTTVLPAVVMNSRRQAIYIEEPEAHLFPSAQSKLVEILAALSVHSTKADRTPDLIMTTHSPYVLQKINNLIKAGQLALPKRASEALKSEISKIVSRKCWLPAAAVIAYAIRDGKLENIMEEEGLINSDYLDEVSGEIAKEFMSLLKNEIK